MWELALTAQFLCCPAMSHQYIVVVCCMPAAFIKSCKETALAISKSNNQQNNSSQQKNLLIVLWKSKPESRTNCKIKKNVNLS